jgi:hypothetical protein
VPANCTFKLQVMDVVFQRHLSMQSTSSTISSKQQR